MVTWESPIFWNLHIFATSKSGYVSRKGPSGGLQIHCTVAGLHCSSPFMMLYCCTYLYIYIYNIIIYIYDPVFRPRGPPPNGMGPQVAPPPALLFARYWQHFWLPASHLLGTCYLLDDLHSTHAPLKYLRATYSHIYMCYVSTSYIYIFTCYRYIHIYIYTHSY